MRLAMTRLATARTASHRRFRPIEKPAPSRGRVYDDEPAACRRDLRQFLPVLAHLGLLLGVALVYRLEGRAYAIILGVALAALPIHYALPFRWKRPFFVAASIAALASVFGVATAAAVVPMATAFIGLALAPIAWRWKALGVGAAALGLGLVRDGAWGLDARLGLPPAAVPILGTLLMFRMILFLYEIKHAKGPESPLDALAYFFLLPNLCFRHFPVVDYRTFQRGYFAADVHALQRRGLRMILRGTLHLLAYRLIYHEILIGPDDVLGPLDLARFLVANYLLYLHVSGQFHVACGLLHLFGHQLPDTHHQFLLATGFTDYWRRINIYWKDFMVRVVFNPTVMRLKRRPRPVALAAGTLVVFVATWLLHAYQKFWLTGHWGFSVQDGLFWGILGLLVLVNVQLDARRGRLAPPETNAGRIVTGLARGAKVAGTFATITLLWSLWTSAGVGPWLEMLRRGLTGA